MLRNNGYSGIRMQFNCGTYIRADNKVEIEMENSAFNVESK